MIGPREPIDQRVGRGHVHQPGNHARRSIEEIADPQQHRLPGGDDAESAEWRRDFVRSFLERDVGQLGLRVPVVVRVFNDRSFELETKSPAAVDLLKQAAGIAKGSGAPNKDKVGKVTLKQIEDIAKVKLPDLNANDVAAAMKIIEGTAKNMGLEIIRG